MKQGGLFDAPDGQLFDPSNLTQVQRNVIADQIEFGRPRLFMANRLEKEMHGVIDAQAS